MQILLPIFPVESTLINKVLSFEKREATLLYFHGCMPVFSHSEDDYASFNMYTSKLVVLGQCKQVETVKAFGVCTISVIRHVKKHWKDGPGIFSKERSVRNSTVLTPAALTRAQGLLNEGNSCFEVSGDLGINPIRFIVQYVQVGWLNLKKVDCKSERSIEDAQSTMGMGCTRVIERVMASIGNLSETPTRSRHRWVCAMQECCGRYQRYLTMAC